MDELDTRGGIESGIEVRLAELERNLAEYRKEIRNAQRPRRTLAGPWTGVALAWLGAIAVSITTIVAFAASTTDKPNGTVGWVVFVAVAGAVITTFLATVTSGD